MPWPPYMKDKNGYCYITTMSIIGTPHLTAWYGRVGADGYAQPGTEPAPRWAGQTVVCLASGPSLTEQDCAYVRGKARVITTNDTCYRAPWADIMLAADHGWWQQHQHQAPTGPEWWTCSYAAIQEFANLELFRTNLATRNTGAKAVELAIHLGASTVVLLGFDCSLVNGVHWHGPHERTSNPDEKIVSEWVDQFELVAQLARDEGVRVINCSQQTALDCFERVALEDAL